MGQRSQGFTIYARNNADAQRLQVVIDRELTAKGLAVAEPMQKVNVDIIAGSSNHVGTVRDWFVATRGDVLREQGVLICDRPRGALECFWRLLIRPLPENLQFSCNLLDIQRVRPVGRRE